MATYTDIYRFIKPEGSEQFDIDFQNQNWDAVDERLSILLSKTTADISFYISTTGLDTNDGLSETTPFRTIAKAIESTPGVINHAVTYNLMPGVYDEDVAIGGFVGIGTIQLLGDTVVSDTRTVNSITVSYSALYIGIVGINAISTTKHGFSSYGCTRSDFIKCRAVSVAPSFHGVYYSGSTGFVTECVLSNHSNGIYANVVSYIMSTDNSGDNNAFGLLSTTGSTICKVRTQPLGTTNERQTNSGKILSQNSENTNQSISNQTLTASTPTYIIGSNLKFVAKSLHVGTRFKWVMVISKTAAGTASSTISIRLGTSGSTSDSEIISLVKPAGTAVADTGYFTIDAVITYVNEDQTECIIKADINMTHNLTSTGMCTTSAIVSQVTSSTFSISTATNIGIVMTTGASDAYTVKMVMTDAVNF